MKTRRIFVLGILIGLALMIYGCAMAEGATDAELRTVWEEEKLSNRIGRMTREVVSGQYSDDYVVIQQTQAPTLGGTGIWGVTYYSPASGVSLISVNASIQMKQPGETDYTTVYRIRNGGSSFESCEIMTAGEYRFIVFATYSDGSSYYNNYDFTIEDDAAHPTLAEKIAEVTAGCAGANDWETALNLHDWLINNAHYDRTYSYYGAEGVLLRGYGVCDSYSKAYQLLCQEAGIPVSRVIGTADGQDHSWNAIQIGGKWYLVDVTWDDPIHGSNGTVSGGERHDYFCLNNELMGLDHTGSGSSFDSTQCNSLDANWQLINHDWAGMGDGTFIGEEISFNTVAYYSDMIQAQLEAGETSFTVECEDTFYVIRKSANSMSYSTGDPSNSARALRSWSLLATSMSQTPFTVNGEEIVLDVTFDLNATVPAFACAIHDDGLDIPQADERMVLRPVERDEGVTGRFDLLLNDWVDFEFTASGDLYDMTVPYEVILDGEVFDRIWADNRGFSETHWTTDSLEQVGQHVMYVRYQTGDTWYYSNAYIINVTAPYSIEGTLSWTVDESMTVLTDEDQNPIYDGNGNPVYSIALDGRLIVDVNNIRGQGVRFYGMYIEDGNGGWIADSHWVQASDWQQEPGADNATTRVPLTVPRCTPGEEYQAYVFAVKQGAPFLIGEEPITIHVTERADTSHPVIVSMADSYTTGEPLRVFAHYTNPQQLEGVSLQIRIRNVDVDWDQIYNDRKDANDFWDDGAVCWHTGRFAVDAYVWQWNEDLQDDELIGTYEDLWEFDVTADPEISIAVPQLVNAYDTYSAEDDLVLSFTSTAGTNTVAADRIEVSLIRMDWDHDWIGLQEAEIKNGAATVTFAYDDYCRVFESGGCYALWISGMKAGYNEVSAQYRFVMTGDALPANPNLTLTVDDSTETPQAKYSSTDMNVRVTWGADTSRPTAVRVLNGDEWEYWWKQDEDFEREWAFHEDELLMYAEATWTNIDIETIEQNGWKITENGETREFDWNRDVVWTGKSNAVRVSVSSPYGTMVPANYTIQNPADDQGKVTIQYGDDLVINIEDPGPMGTDANGGEAHVIPGSWYAGHIYRWEENEYDGRWERVNRDFTYPVKSGRNYFPTGDLENGLYKVEIGTDAPGYTGTSVYHEFYIIDPEDQTSPFFQINKIQLHPYEPFIATVYAPGAERVRITREEDGDEVWGEYTGDRGSNGMGQEWQYEEAGEYGLNAWAKYPGTETWTRISSIDITVDPREPLEKATIITAGELDTSAENSITVTAVPNGYYYTLQLHVTDMENQPVHRYNRTAADKDESGNIVFTIPAGELTPNQSYWIDCYVDPADNDYAHEGSDSSRNIRTVEGTASYPYDNNITISIQAPEGFTGNRIPVNEPFDITVSLAANATDHPTAIAVYMGDHVEYRFFSGAQEIIHMSEYQAWPEVIYAKAYYNGFEGNPDWDEVDWDGLAWGYPSNSMVQVTFTSNGQADPPEIEYYPELTMSGRNMVIGITPGEHANEAHANLDRNTSGWQENLVFDGWIGMQNYDPDTGTGTITIPTDGLGPGSYRLYVDNSGNGYENSRSWVEIRIAENPYESTSKLVLPADLETIGEEAFMGVDADTVIIPDNVTTIGARAFMNSKIRLVVIPASVTEIGKNAFTGSRLEIVYGTSETAEQCAEDYGADGYCYIGD